MGGRGEGGKGGSGRGPVILCFLFAASLFCISVVGLLSPLMCLICNFYLSVAARKIVCADPSLRYTSMLLGR